MAYSKDPQVEKSLRYSLKDSVAYSIMSGGVESYFSLFALSILKASNSQIALIAALPSFIGAFFQLLSAWIGHRLNKRKPLMLVGAFSQAGTLLPMFVLPVMFPDYAILFFILFLTLYFGMVNFAMPQWTSLMGELVPEKKRGRYFGFRTRLATITSFLALFLAGLLLHYMKDIHIQLVPPFDLASLLSYGLQQIDVYHMVLIGFGLLFGIGFFARILSCYYLTCMLEPTQHAVSIEPVKNLRWLRHAQFRPALRFSAFFVSMQIAVWIAAPFFTAYMWNTLKYNYLEIMLVLGVSAIAQFLTLGYWGRISDIVGNRLVLITTGALVTVLPVFWLFSTNYWYILLVQVVAGFSWAGFSLSTGNMLYDLIPAQKRATYQALHSVALGAGILLGGILGALIDRYFPASIQIGAWSLDLTTTLYWAFLISTLLRVLVAFIFMPRLQELRKVRKTVSPYALIVRFTRFDAFIGFFYEIVTKIKRRP